ncbi:hypothetical protein [Microbacterium alcoholitolerans]|uniref:hypothetical protein n=1 Tax=unclassified Microbacterium TaxID=2609290 RepID=UPI003D16E386
MPRTLSKIRGMPESVSNLEPLIPPHEPASEALITVAGIALDAIPIVGPMGARALDHALATRDRERRSEFDHAVITELRRQADSSLTVGDVIASDDFLAALARGQRVAAETTSALKRNRLVAAVANTITAQTLSAHERSSFWQYVERYEDLHIWLLSFFSSPIEWLDAHGLSAAHERIVGGAIAEPLSAALGFDPRLAPAVRDAIEELQRDMMLGVFDLNTVRSERGQFNSQTTDRGRRFLAFLLENEPHSLDAPERPRGTPCWSMPARTASRAASWAGA